MLSPNCIRDAIIQTEEKNMYDKIHTSLRQIIDRKLRTVQLLGKKNYIHFFFFLENQRKIWKIESGLQDLMEMLD
jgi:hypothetical protein